MTPISGDASRASGSPSASLAELRERALTALGGSLGRPPLALQEEVDSAERAVVRLRDALIVSLRRDADTVEAAAWRTALQQVNAALSLVVAVEYPVAGEQRKLVEQAHAALEALLL